ncbi:MAG: MBL fold metallo-hydrolase [Clostridia bacterium]|nr:MBL fold metallo-hydrolase [Clostridia bacterium]
MARRKSVSKNIKSTITKTVSFLLVAFILVMAIICYLNPVLYNKILRLIGKTDLLGNISHTDYNSTEDSAMIVHFIDVGQGDAILIELPDETKMLIDAGDNKIENNNKLVSYLTDINITKIDYLIATHADADHIGGMDKIFYNFEVKKVYRPYVFYAGDDYSFSKIFNKGASSYAQSSKTYGGFLNDILNETYVENGKTKKCDWVFFDSYNHDFGGNIYYEGVNIKYAVDFLTPTSDLSKLEYADANDYSPIIKVSYGDFDLLLTGDAEKSSEAEFVKAYSEKEEYINYVDVELLKVGHHGSGTSTSKAFLNLIKPEYAVISCGEGNSYFHPHQEVLDRLINANCQNVYRTDNNGDIVLTIKRSGEFKFDVAKYSENNLIAPIRS